MCFKNSQISQICYNFLFSLKYIITRLEARLFKVNQRAVVWVFPLFLVNELEQKYESKEQEIKFSKWMCVCVCVSTDKSTKIIYLTCAFPNSNFPDNRFLTIHFLFPYSTQNCNKKIITECFFIIWDDFQIIILKLH